MLKATDNQLGLLVEAECVHIGRSIPIVSGMRDAITTWCGGPAVVSEGDLFDVFADSCARDGTPERLWPKDIPRC